jgi:hypothetical protein
MRFTGKELPGAFTLGREEEDQMKTTRQLLVEHLEERGWSIKADSALDLASMVCSFLAERMEKDEPYAVRDIAALKSAAMTCDLTMNE